MSKLKIMVSKNGKIFVKRCPTSGRVQKAFKEKIGDPTGKCVKSKVTKGMSAAEIHKIAKECAPNKGTVKLF